jgi:hypothetical protein
MVAAVVVLTAPVVARVTVEKGNVVVVRKTFDRRDPPKEMPPLGPHADAVTHFRFGCSANANYEVVSRRRDTSRRRGPSECTATARINDMDIKLDLEVTIWVPRGARKKLVDHEEGHRVIGERVYATAEQAARDLARRWAGRTVTGRADNCAEAADTAVRDASHQFCQDYLEATSGWSARVGDVYDAITDHGRRDVAVDDAIAQAFERDAREQREAKAAPADASAARRAE